MGPPLQRLSHNGLVHSASMGLQGHGVLVQALHYASQRQQILCPSLPTANSHQSLLWQQFRIGLLQVRVRGTSVV